MLVAFDFAYSSFRQPFRCNRSSAGTFCLGQLALAVYLGDVNFFLLLIDTLHFVSHIVVVHEALSERRRINDEQMKSVLPKDTL